MATITQRLEAFRNVLVDQDYRQSGRVEDFDESIQLHHQFFLEGPEIAGELHAAAGLAITPWVMRARIAFEPRLHRSDPDKGRFEIATDLDGLVDAWTGDTTVHADVFTVASASPEWVDDPGFWVVLVEASFSHVRTI